MWRTHSKYPWCWGNTMFRIKFDSSLSIPFLNNRLHVNYFFENENVISRISKTSFINAFDITKLIHHHDTKVCYLRKENKFRNRIIDQQRKLPILCYTFSKNALIGLTCKKTLSVLCLYIINHHQTKCS